jgi:hypothetical protein
MLPNSSDGLVYKFINVNRVKKGLVQGGWLHFHHDSQKFIKFENAEFRK